MSAGSLPSAPAVNQSSNTGNHSANNFSNNIMILNGVQVPKCAPATFAELIRSGWWVSPPGTDLKSLRDHHHNTLVADTATWIFEDDRYNRWMEGEGPRFLWLCGGPGTGKTRLAKSVASKFLSGPNSTPEIVNLVPYFVSPRVSKNSASADEIEPPNLMLAKVASDLLYCILQQDESVYHYCKAELEIQGPKFFTNYESLWRVLRDAINNCRAHSVCILIDGIDRFGIKLCKRLIKGILELIRIQKVKIFLCSREAPHISNTLSNDPRKRITINLDTNDFIKGDVETFIRKRVELFGWDNDLRDRATEALLEKSEGFFLWASFAVKNLKNYCLGPNYERFLEQPPPGLEAEYGKMLSVSPSRSDAGTVMNMIWSVAVAVRPPTFAELSRILPCIEEMAIAKRPIAHPGGSEIQPMSGKELRIYVRSSLGFLRATETTVFMVHRTAREYLLRKWKQGSLYVVSKSEADLAVSWECFRYVHHVFGDPGRFPRRNFTARSTVSGVGRDREHEGLREPACEVSRNDPEQAVSNREFLRYAAESWLIHAHRSIETSEDMLYDDSVRDWLQCQFFDTSDVVRKPWIELCGDPRMEILAGKQTQFDLAVCLGLTPLVEQALRNFTEGANNNQSPLHLAAKLMSGTYQILIDKTEPPLLIAPDRDGNTPLHEAARSGHLPMVKGLVEKLAGYGTYDNEINGGNDFGNTPLHLAFQLDHPKIVKLLVRQGTNPTIKNKDRLTALELGERLGRGECLRILTRSRKETKGKSKGKSKGKTNGKTGKGRGRRAGERTRETRTKKTGKKTGKRAKGMITKEPGRGLWIRFARWLWGV